MDPKFRIADIRAYAVTITITDAPGFGLTLNRAAVTLERPFTP